VDAQVLDRLLNEFAPPGPPTGHGESFTLGEPHLDVSRFYVAWNPGQVYRIVERSQTTDGSYVAYLGRVDERTRVLFSLALGATGNHVVRFLRPTWKHYSWGVAAKIARDIGLSDPRPVLVTGYESDFKVVTFVASRDLPRVREALFSAGAGRYGLYSRCSFSGPGRGTFMGEKGSRPAYGEPGKMEEIDENRLEVLVSHDRLGKALAALRKVHPYEEPVIETYQVGSEREVGEGRIGKVRTPLGCSEVSRKVVSVLGSQPVFVSGDAEVHQVIVWDGEPERGLFEAALRKADLYVGPDTRGLARLLSIPMKMQVIEFPNYCFVVAGAKELVYTVREKSKREGWGLRTFLPSKSGREGAIR
jgi:hypothetical protein